MTFNLKGKVPKKYLMSILYFNFKIILHSPHKVPNLPFKLPKFYLMQKLIFLIINISIY